MYCKRGHVVKIASHVPPGVPIQPRTSLLSKARGKRAPLEVDPFGASLLPFTPIQGKDTFICPRDIISIIASLPCLTFHLSTLCAASCFAGLPTASVNTFIQSSSGTSLGPVASMAEVTPNPTGSFIGGAWINNGTPLPAIPFPNSAQPPTATSASWLLAIDPSIDGSYLKMVELQIVILDGTAFAFVSAARYAADAPPTFDAASVNSYWANSTAAPLAECTTCSGYAYYFPNVICITPHNGRCGGWSITPRIDPIL